MKSIEIIVPRDLVKKFYPHPENYGNGNYVVDLVNGMFTDVFYREEGDFVTLTNDEEIIDYLKSNYIKPREYVFINGVFSVREVDSELTSEWKVVEPKKVSATLPHDINLKGQYFLCFYWIEVGIIKVENMELVVKVYENELIDDLSVKTALNVFIESMEWK